MKKAKSNVGHLFHVTLRQWRVWFNVEFFEDRRSMRRRIRMFMGAPATDILAYTHRFVNVHGTTFPCLGVILLNRKDLNVNIIAHECFHATALYAQWEKIPLNHCMKWLNDDHEDLAEFHGDLVEAVIKSLDSHGIPV